MSSALAQCRSGHRFVGDPVDVVTGAVIDASPDLVQRGPIPLRLMGFYNSARCKLLGSRGWGHSHNFDCRLHRDLDGLRYEDALGGTAGFQDLAIGARDASGGMLLTRNGDHVYVIAQPGEPDQEFHFPEGSAVARLARLRQGDDTIEFRYAGNGALREIVDSRGRLIRVISDASGRVLKLALADPKTGGPGTTLLAYQYDRAGNLIGGTDIHKSSFTFAYDASNRMTRRTDRRGYSFHFEYDNEGRCVHSRGDDGLLEVFLDYEPDAKTTFVRRGDGGQWIYVYDDNGTITQITDPYGNATKYTLDDLGRPVEEIDPNGNITRLHYDWLGHDYRIDPNGRILPTKEEDPDPPDPLAYELPESPLEWEFGHLLDADSIKPPQADDTVLRQFPAAVFNTILGMTDAYDPMALGESDGVAAPRSMLEDDFGQPLELTGPSFTERWKYDPNGNPIEHQDRQGAVWRSVFKSWNALSQEVDPLGNVTAYEHSVQGLVAKVTDPGGTVTEYGYDLREKLVEVRRHGRVRERYSLDKAGNIIAKTNTHGRTLAAWEIGAGNLDKVRILGSGEKHVFVHDEMGRVTEAQTPTGTVTISYDDDHIISDLRDGKGVVHEFDFDQLITTTYFDKFKVVYEVNDNGDLIVIDCLQGQHRFQRSENGLIAKHLANGDRELCQFDAQGRSLRKALVQSTSGATPWMRSLAYSSVGNLVAISDTVRGLTRYSYDAAHRLVQEVIPDGIARRFAYDAAGNLHTQPGLANVLMDKGNRLLEANGDRFTYNDRDHLSQRIGPRGTTRYEYNDLDMLVRCDINGEPWTASYDAYCRRVTKTWQGRTTTYYWDDFRLAAEVRHDGSVRIYVYADEIALVPFLFLEYADLEAEPASGQRYYVFTNQVGAPIRVDDANGKPCWMARIDPYGRAEVSKDSTLEMPLRFPGHYYDPESRLHYNRFRYFSPELGRYLQSDPLGLEGGINLYAYPARPLTAVDIDGLGTKTKKAGSPQEQALRHAEAMCRLHARNTEEGQDWRYKRYEARLALENPPRKADRKEWEGKSKGTSAGKQATIDHINRERDRILRENPGWEHTHGGNDAVSGERKKEFYVPGPNGGQQGSTRPDLTFSKPDGTNHHHNTVDTEADGTTMTDREKTNLNRLQAARPNDSTSTSPKPK
jgi:RHS repeat-associated protein